MKVFQGVRYLGPVPHGVSSTTPRSLYPMHPQSQLYLAAYLAARVPHMVADYPRKRTSHPTFQGVLERALHSALLPVPFVHLTIHTLLLLVARLYLSTTLA